MKKKQTQRWVSVPAVMKEDIDALGLSATRTDNLAKFITRLKSNSENKFGKGNFTEISTFASTYLKDVYTSKYAEFLNPAIKAGIIIRDDSYDTKKGISKGYSISKKYYSLLYINNLNIDRVGIVKRNIVNNNTSIPNCYHFGEGQSSQTLTTTGLDAYAEKYTNTIISHLEYEEKMTEREKKYQSPYFTQYCRDMKTLVKNESKMKLRMLDKIEEITEDVLTLNENIKATTIGIWDGKETKYYSTKVHIEIAKKEGKDIIQYKNKYYKDNPKTFIQKKQLEVMHSTLEGIYEITKEQYRASRNHTNNRLDTNLTNISSEIVEVLKEDNDLVELDMANSQFAIFSHILEDEDCSGDDVERFKQLCYNGELYTYIQKRIGLKTRDEAKTVMFEVNFGNHKFQTENYKKVKEAFPNVVNWIEEYKENNGYKQFSIMLQKKESEMFIDHIYGEIKKMDNKKDRRKGLFLLTKHDSLIIRREDLDTVSDFVQMYFDSIGFLGRLR